MTVKDIDFIKKWISKHGGEVRFFNNKAFVYYQDEGWIIKHEDDNNYSVYHRHGRTKSRYHLQKRVDNRPHLSAIAYIMDRVIKTHNPYIRPKLRKLDRITQLLGQIS